jgi:uncharacterized protein
VSLKARITEDMKAAMRARASERLGTIRMLQAGIKQREVDERIELDDTQVLGVIEKMIKQRKEAAQQFEAAGRTDLFDKENREIEVLSGYLPAALTEPEVDALIERALSESGATTLRDMGRAMAIVKREGQGRCDMAAVSARLKARLSG